MSEEGNNHHESVATAPAVTATTTTTTASSSESQNSQNEGSRRATRSNSKGALSPVQKEKSRKSSTSAAEDEEEEEQGEKKLSLNDIPYVKAQIETTMLDSDLMKSFHKLISADGSEGTKQVRRKNMYKFAGFNFESDEKRKEVLDTITSWSSSLQDETLKFLGVDAEDNKPEAILAFLEDPKDHGKVVPVASPKQTKKRGRKRASEDGDKKEDEDQQGEGDESQQHIEKISTAKSTDEAGKEEAKAEEDGHVAKKQKLEENGTEQSKQEPDSEDKGQQNTAGSTA